MNGEEIRNWKMAAAPYLKALFGHSTGEIYEDVTQPRFEQDTPNTSLVSYCHITRFVTCVLCRCTWSISSVYCCYCCY